VCYQRPLVRWAELHPRPSLVATCPTANIAVDVGVSVFADDVCRVEVRDDNDPTNIAEEHRHADSALDQCVTPWGERQNRDEKELTLPLVGEKSMQTYRRARPTRWV
jgi:hypothetical protein